MVIIEPELRSEVMKNQEKLAREYLIETSKIIEAMNENTSKERINEKLDYIFKKEKEKKEIAEREKIEKEKEKENEKEKLKQKEERQRN